MLFIDCRKKPTGVFFPTIATSALRSGKLVVVSEDPKIRDSLAEIFEGFEVVHRTEEQAMCEFPDNYVVCKSLLPPQRAVEVEDTLPPQSDVISEIIPNLFIGNMGVSQNHKELASRGIRRVINVSTDIPMPFEDMKYLRVPLEDSPKAKINLYFEDTFQFIDEGLKAGEGVLVHCFAGVSRSATIVCAYLMKRYSIPFETAMETLRYRREIVDPNLFFCIQLMNYN